MGRRGPPWTGLVLFLPPGQLWARRAPQRLRRKPVSAQGDRADATTLTTWRGGAPLGKLAWFCLAAIDCVICWWTTCSGRRNCTAARAQPHDPDSQSTACACRARRSPVDGVGRRRLRRQEATSLFHSRTAFYSFQFLPKPGSGVKYSKPWSKLEIESCGNSLGSAGFG